MLGSECVAGVEPVIGQVVPDRSHHEVSRLPVVTRPDMGVEDGSVQRSLSGRSRSDSRVTAGSSASSTAYPGSRCTSPMTAKPAGMRAMTVGFFAAMRCPDPVGPPVSHVVDHR